MIALCNSTSPTMAQETTYQDAKSVMKEGYWKLWNEDVQKKIDADIDKYRKANAEVRITNVTAGTQSACGANLSRLCLWCPYI